MYGHLEPMAPRPGAVGKVCIGIGRKETGRLAALTFETIALRGQTERREDLPEAAKRCLEVSRDVVAREKTLSLRECASFDFLVAESRIQGKWHRKEINPLRYKVQS